jgi:hypothetical protein
LTRRSWRVPRRLLGVASENPATRNRTRDHLIAATFYSQMLYQLSYSRSVEGALAMGLDSATAIARKRRSLRIKSSARFAVAPREPVPRQFLGLRPRWARGKAFGGSFSTLRHELGRPPGLPRPSGTKAMSAMGVRAHAQLPAVDLKSTP